MLRYFYIQNTNRAEFTLFDSIHNDIYIKDKGALTPDGIF